MAVLLSVKCLRPAVLLPCDRWNVWQCLKMTSWSSRHSCASGVNSVATVGNRVLSLQETAVKIQSVQKYVCLQHIRTMQTRSDKKTQLVESQHKPGLQLTFEEKGTVCHELLVSYAVCTCFIYCIAGQLIPECAFSSVDYWLLS